MWCKLTPPHTHTPPFMEYSLTILFVRNSEDCFPASFDNAFCSITWPTRICLTHGVKVSERHNVQQSHSHYTAICNQGVMRQTNRITHTWTTTRCRTQRRKRLRARIDRSHTRRTHEVPFIAGWSHFTQKNTRFRAPALSLKSKPMHHWCSHYTAICNQGVNKRTWTTTRCRTQRRNRLRARIDRSRTRRTHEVPFIAGWSQFTRKNTRFRAPAFPPTQDPVNLHDLHSHSTLHWV